MTTGTGRAARPAGGRELPSLPFTDLYINLDDPRVPARYRADPTRSRTPGNRAVPAEFASDIDAVRHEVSSAVRGTGAITFKGIRLRYTRFVAAEGELWAAMRGVPLDLPSLSGLRLDPTFAGLVQSWGQKRGLVVVGGRTGNGKTTTCVAALRDYLERLGGFAFTIEDPPEYQMQGAISEGGFCLQNEIHDESQWRDAVMRAMRSRPDYMLLGEIRSPDAAEQLLKAATSGHLVLTTVHGGSVPDAIAAIVQLAESRMGPLARAIIADRLVAAVYQELTPNGPRNVVVAPRRDDANDQTATIIAGGDLAHLSRFAKTFEPRRPPAR